MHQSQSSVLPETGQPAPERAERRPFVERIAGWSARHKKTAVFGWLALVAVLFVASQALGSRNLPNYDPGQAGQAERALHQAAPDFYGSASEVVLIQARAPGKTFAGDASMRQAARQVVSALAALPESAAHIRSPLTAGARQAGRGSLVSADGRSALVTFDVPGRASNQDQAVAADQRAVAVVQARHPDLRVAEAGDASITRAIDNSLNFRQAEATSVPITLILLLVVFGALVAAGIPILLAVSAVMAALSLVTISSHWLPAGNSTAEVVLIVGMAVGVDYSLFYLRREREERARGRSFAEALRIAAGTSGRSILVSGVTVMIAMAGLFLTGIDQFTGIALGTIAVVGIAVAGSLTVIPALLSWLGPRADRGRIPFLGRGRAAARPSRLWAALVRRVVAHPVIWGVTAAAALIALAAPALGMRLGEPAVDVPPGQAVVATTSAIHRAFPQTPVACRGRRDRPGCHRPAGDGRGRRAAGARGSRRCHPRAGDRHRGRRPGQWRGPGRGCPAGRHGVGRGVGPGLADLAQPDPARHAGPGSRDQLRGDRRHGQPVRLHPPAARPDPGGARARRRAGLRAAAGRVPFRRDLAGLDPPEPAVGRRGLRADHADLPGRAAAGRCSATPRSAGSSPGCRCSCSCSCSGSAWTTTCSS